jgi:hypothetical protein
MKHIKAYKIFESESSASDDDCLYIFDFDDTLADAPHFEDLAIEYLKEDVTIGSLLKKSIKLIGKSLDDIKIEHGRLYVNDPNEEISVKGNWVRKKGRVYLVSPDSFYFQDMSFPTKTLELSKLYNSVKNKAIVTGRFKKVENKVLDSLKKFELDIPNKGLFCYPSRDESGDKLAMWKAKTIVELIRKEGFNKAKFYDDKSKIVTAVIKAVKTQLPDVEFEGIKVKK